MDPDEQAYKKSVRNMSLILAAIVIVVFAFIFIPPLVNPTRDNFQQSASLGSPQGFTLNLTINSTEVTGSGHLNITAWATNGSESPLNVTTQSAWGVEAANLWYGLQSCWPLGVGLMQGQYDQSNYTRGSLVSFGVADLCQQGSAPAYYDFFPHSSRVLVDINGTPHFVTLTVNLVIGVGPSYPLPGVGGGTLQAGVYTIVAADEWGDVLTTNFRVA